MKHDGSRSHSKSYTNPEVQRALERALEWATPSQATAVRSLLKHGSVAAAADAMGLAARTLREHLTELQRRAARAGWSPEHDMTKTVPDGYFVKGVSTYYGKDGEPRGQWVKSQKDQEHQLAVLMDAIQGLAEPFKGKSARPKAPRTTMKDLLCVYPMGDPHIGMFAWAKETGQDFDLDLAERHLVDAVDHLVALAPPSETALVVNLGDLIHADGKHNNTTAGTPLDVDTRWPKVVGVALRAMRRCIDRALMKHKKVFVVCKPGNHDEHTGMLVALCLAMYYENNPRVEVDTTPDVFSYHRFGKCLLGITHGNTVRPQDLPSVMACDRAKDWGETTYRHWLTGHVHHESKKEYNGCIVETFRTLAPRDAWTHASGYRSGQDMKLLILHREYGRENEHTVGISRIWGTK